MYVLRDGSNEAYVTCLMAVAATTVGQHDKIGQDQNECKVDASLYVCPRHVQMYEWNYKEASTSFER